MKKSADILARFKDSGLKLTPFRRRLVKVLSDARSPLSAAQISERIPDGDRVTLFRNLKWLTESKVLNATDFGTGATFYCLNTEAGHHHHVFCVRCETARPLDTCVVGPLITQARKLGFDVLGHKLELMGLCPECRP